MQRALNKSSYDSCVVGDEVLRSYTALNHLQPAATGILSPYSPPSLSAGL